MNKKWSDWEERSRSRGTVRVTASDSGSERVSIKNQHSGLIARFFSCLPGFLISFLLSEIQIRNSYFLPCTVPTAQSFFCPARAHAGPQRESVSWVGRLAPFNGRLVEVKCLDHKSARFVKVL